MKINTEAIKQYRIHSGLTQNDVAIRLGVSEATISRYESGAIEKVSPKVMLGYAKLFHVPINTFYENAQTEWVTALEEAGLQDPRVAGFIEYLEEQAQKEYNASSETKLSNIETEIISAYRQADGKTRHLVAYALGLNIVDANEKGQPD